MYRFNNPIDHPDTGRDLLFRLSNDEAVKVFFSTIGVLVWTGFSFLNATLATNADLCSTFTLHLLQAVTAWSNQKSEKVDLRELFYRDVNLLGASLGTFLLKILDGWAEIRVVLHCFVNQLDKFIFEFLAVTNLASIRPATVAIIRGWWRRRPEIKSDVAHIVNL